MASTGSDPRSSRAAHAVQAHRRRRAGLRRVGAGAIVLVALALGTYLRHAAQFEQDLRRASAVLLGTEAGDRVEAAHTLDGMVFSEIADTCQGVHPSRQALLRETAFPALLAGLEAPEPGVRFHAAQSMVSFGPEAAKALPALSTLVLDADDEVVRAATMALARLGAPAAEALVAGTHSSNPKTRTWSTYALAGAGPDEVVRRIDLLVALLDDADPGVRQAAGSTLAAAGERARPALPGMVPLLFDPDQAVRLWTAMYVGRIGPDRETAQALARVAASEDADDVRIDALASLGKAQGDGVEGAVLALRRGLRDVEERARWHSAGALGALGPAAASATEELRTVAADPAESERVRVAARASLAQIAR